MRVDCDRCDATFWLWQPRGQFRMIHRRCIHCGQQYAEYQFKGAIIRAVRYLADHLRDAA